MSQYGSPQNSFKAERGFNKNLGQGSNRSGAIYNGEFQALKEPFVELKLVKATDVKKQTFVSNIGDTTKILVSYLKVNCHKLVMTRNSQCFDMKTVGPDGRLAGVLLKVRFINQATMDSNSLIFALCQFAFCSFFGSMSPLTSFTKYNDSCHQISAVMFSAKVNNLTPSSIKSRLTSISVNKDLSNPDYVKMVLGYDEEEKFLMYNLSMVWMEGLQSHSKKGPRNYIVYVLFDPTFLDSGTPRSLEAFIKSIYYVGSGMPGRPLDHLRDYLNQNRRQPWKLRLKIHELYPLQKYVMLPIRVNLFRQQAFLYETCIIEFLCSGGRDQLVNQNRGHQIFSHWSSGEHGHYGAYMLENYGFSRIRDVLTCTSMYMF